MESVNLPYLCNGIGPSVDAICSQRGNQVQRRQDRFFSAGRGSLSVTAITLPPTPVHQEGHPEDCWGSKIKGWWRTGDIRVQKPKKTYEYWVKNKTKIPPRAQDTIIPAVQEPNHNFGKDECVVDMMGHEAHYLQGTKSLTKLTKLTKPRGRRAYPNPKPYTLNPKLTKLLKQLVTRHAT